MKAAGRRQARRGQPDRLTEIGRFINEVKRETPCSTWQAYEDSKGNKPLPQRSERSDRRVEGAMHGTPASGSALARDASFWSGSIITPPQ